MALCQASVRRVDKTRRQGGESGAGGGHKTQGKVN